MKHFNRALGFTVLIALSFLIVGCDDPPPRPLSPAQAAYLYSRYNSSTVTSTSTVTATITSVSITTVTAK